MCLRHILSIMSNSMTKQAAHPKTTQTDSPLAIVSMVLGVISLTGPGLLLGIPAIILAIIALKQGAGGRGLSIAGLVTGAVSTLFSILFIAFIMFVAWGLEAQDHTAPETQQEQFESTKA